MYIYIPKSCISELMDSLSRFLYVFYFKVGTKLFDSIRQRLWRNKEKVMVLILDGNLEYDAHMSQMWSIICNFICLRH